MGFPTTKTESQVLEIHLRTIVSDNSGRQVITRSSPEGADTQLHAPRSHPILIDHARRLLQSLAWAIRLLEMRFGCSLAEDHPGWTITDQLNLPAHGECRYVLELLCGQSVAVELDAASSLEVLVCEDDDYDFWEESGCLPDSHWWITGPMDEEMRQEFEFRAPRTTAVDVVVTNNGDRATRAKLRIHAAPCVPMAHYSNQKRAGTMRSGKRTGSAGPLGCGNLR